MTKRYRDMKTDFYLNINVRIWERETYTHGKYNCNTLKDDTDFDLYMLDSSKYSDKTEKKSLTILWPSNSHTSVPSVYELEKVTPATIRNCAMKMQDIPFVQQEPI